MKTQICKRFKMALTAIISIAICALCLPYAGFNVSAENLLPASLTGPTLSIFDTSNPPSTFAGSIGKWFNFNAGTGFAAYSEIDTVDKHGDDTGSVKITHASTSLRSRAATFFELKGGKTYELSFWAKVENYSGSNLTQGLRFCYDIAPISALAGNSWWDFCNYMYGLNQNYFNNLDDFTGFPTLSYIDGETEKTMINSNTDWVRVSAEITPNEDSRGLLKIVVGYNVITAYLSDFQLVEKVLPPDPVENLIPAELTGSPLPIFDINNPPSTFAGSIGKWYNFVSGAGLAVNAEVDTVNKHGDSLSSLKITHASSSLRSRGATFFELEGGKTYELSFWAKVENYGGQNASHGLRFSYGIVPVSELAGDSWWDFRNYMASNFPNYLNNNDDFTGQPTLSYTVGETEKTLINSNTDWVRVSAEITPDEDSRGLLKIVVGYNVITAYLSDFQLIKLSEDLSPDVQNVIDAIGAIGTVTPWSESAIMAAQAAFDALDPVEREQVSNAATLTEAWTAFNAFRPSLAGATLYMADGAQYTDYADGTIAYITNKPSGALPAGSTIVEYGTIAHPFQLLDSAGLTLDTVNLGKPARVRGEGLTVPDAFYAIFVNSADISGGVRIAARSYIIYKDAGGTTHTVYGEVTYNKSANRIKRDMAIAMIADASYTAQYDDGDIPNAQIDINTADIGDVWSFIKRNRTYFDSLQ